MKLERRKVSFLKRFGYLVMSFGFAVVMYMSTGDVGDGVFSMSTEFEGSYVIEDMEIEYLIDESKYEVIVPESNPYVVVRGDKKLLNLLKLTGEPRFTIDLSDKGVGKYQERVIVEGIHKDLDVEVYPGLMDVRVQELQTMRLVPLVELEGVERLEGRGYVPSVPELLNLKEVRIRDRSSVLSEVGQVRGVVDVSDLDVGKTEISVDLIVFDKAGNVMDANLVDEEIRVSVDVKERGIEVSEKVVEKIVEVERLVEVEKDSGKNESDKKDTDKTSSDKDGSEGAGKTEDDSDKGSEVSKPDVGKVEEVKKEGRLTFVRLGKEYEIESRDMTRRFSSNIRVDVSGFGVGKYELRVKDLGEETVLRFEIRLKGVEDGVEVVPEEGSEGVEVAPEGVEDRE